MPTTVSLRIEGGEVSKVLPRGIDGIIAHHDTQRVWEARGSNATLTTYDSGEQINALRQVLLNALAQCGVKSNEKFEVEAHGAQILIRVLRVARHAPSVPSSWSRALSEDLM